MRSVPTQRLAIAKELYRLLLDGLYSTTAVLCICIFVDAHTEVLLNSRSELLVYMVSSGLLRVIGDIIVDETDPLALVCFFASSFSSSFFLIGSYCSLYTCRELHICY